MSPSLRTPHSALRTPRGFTFVEILFAIIILGIGMIMIAGVLPVAIKQNSDTRDELTAKAVAEAGYAYVRAAVQQSPDAFRPTVTTYDRGPGDSTSGLDDNFGSVRALNNYIVFEDHAGLDAPLPIPTLVAQRRPPLFNLSALQSSRINSSDPRFQWLAFYRRDLGAPTMQLIVMAMRLHNTDPTDRYSAATLEQEFVNEGNGPFVVNCTVEDGGIEPDRLTFTGGRYADIAAPGAFVIVKHSPSTTADPQRAYRNNGRIFRLGQRRDDLAANGSVWDLVPGYDLPSLNIGADGIPGTADDTIDDTMSTAVTAWMVGRGRRDPAADKDDMQFAGLPQDILVLKVDLPVQ